MTREEDEREKLWSAVHALGERVSETETLVKERTSDLKEVVKEAVTSAMPVSLLSSEEHQWVQNAIKRQAQSIEFRRKIIEGGAMWSMLGLIGWMALILKEYITNHGWRP